jgi:VWFA-related protein
MRSRCTPARLLLASLFGAIVLMAAPMLRAGQTNTAPRTPVRSSPDDIAPSAQQQSARIRTETIVVPVRVVVRDSNGNAIGTLKKQDFKLFQDGKEQQILNFTPVNAASEGRSAGTAFSAPSAATNSAASSSTARVIAPATRFIALFFDDVHVELPDLMRARNAAVRYVQTSVQPGDRVALFTVSGLSQVDFTSDIAALVKKMNALLPQPVSADDPNRTDNCPPMDFPEADAIINYQISDAIDIATDDALACAFAGDAKFRREAQELAIRTAQHLVFEYEIETEMTFRRIREVVRRISALPGQRDVVLISPGFLTTNYGDELSDVIDQAIHLNVVVNTLDPRGLDAPLAGGDLAAAPVRHSPIGEAAVDSFRMSDETYEKSFLVELADATGGRAFINNNDFDAGMRALAATPDVYYLLTYTPHNLQANGHYHHLNVTLNVKGNLTAEARRGFYAPPRNETVAQAARRAIEDAVFSQDEQHDLPVDVQTRIENAANGRKQLDIYADMDIAHLHFQKTNGLNEEGLTIVAALFDSNGNYVDGTQKMVTFNLKDSTLADYSKTGASSEIQLNVKPGVYFLRFVARDSNDGHMSGEDATVDVPN